MYSRCLKSFVKEKPIIVVLRCPTWNGFDIFGPEKSTTIVPLFAVLLSVGGVSRARVVFSICLVRFRKKLRYGPLHCVRLKSVGKLISAASFFAHSWGGSPQDLASRKHGNAMSPCSMLFGVDNAFWTAVGASPVVVASISINDSLILSLSIAKIVQF